MSELTGKTALVTGGSRGIGRGIVEALAAQGIHVWALARDTTHLDTLKREVAGVETRTGDVTDAQVAAQSLREIQPDILVLNAGATPMMAPIHQLSWDQFSGNWDTDVKATFEFGREALLTPLKPGSVVVIVSSGAALGGSVLSGSYAGAKRTQWFLGQYLQQESNNLKLGIRFVVLVPKQIVSMTDLGNQAATRYAALQGISKEEFMERMGSPRLTPAGVGKSVVALLTDNSFSEGLAFGVNGQGLAALN
jgi:NAD(P)-dependent dehydrogenase (short-subunit alcohol dehydrogenase family)